MVANDEYHFGFKVFWVLLHIKKYNHENIKAHFCFSDIDRFC